MPAKRTMTFQLEPHHRDVPDEELIQDLRRVAVELNVGRVTIDQYNSCGQFHATTLTRCFGSWFRALDLAGLQRTRNLNISSEDLFQNLTEVWLELGRQPRYSDIESGESRFSAGTYENRFGGWRNALQAFVTWAKGSGACRCKFRWREASESPNIQIGKLASTGSRASARRRNTPYVRGTTRTRRTTSRGSRRTLGKGR